MGTKENPGVFDCHGKAAPDEPTFTLLARDPAASVLVGLWVVARVGIGKNDEDDAQVQEANECSHRMAEWANARGRGDRRLKVLRALYAALPFAIKALEG